MSGIFGIRYRVLRLAAGYSLVKPEPLCRDWFDFFDKDAFENEGKIRHRSKPYSDFYLPDGTEIDLDRMLS